MAFYRCGCADDSAYTPSIMRASNYSKPSTFLREGTELYFKEKYDTSHVNIKCDYEELESDTGYAIRLLEDGLVEVRYDCPLIAYYNGKVVLSYDIDSSFVGKTNPSALNRKTLNPPPVKPYYADFVTVGSKVYMIKKEYIYIYDPDTDTWTQSAKCPREDEGSNTYEGKGSKSTNIAYDGKIFCFGSGYSNGSNGYYRHTYDPETDTWTETYIGSINYSYDVSGKRFDYLDYNTSGGGMCYWRRGCYIEKDGLYFIFCTSAFSVEWRYNNGNESTLKYPVFVWNPIEDIIAIMNSKYYSLPYSPSYVFLINDIPYFTPSGYANTNNNMYRSDAFFTQKEASWVSSNDYFTGITCSFDAIPNSCITHCGEKYYLSTRSDYKWVLYKIFADMNGKNVHQICTIEELERDFGTTKYYVNSCFNNCFVLNGKIYIVFVEKNGTGYGIERIDDDFTIDTYMKCTDYFKSGIEINGKVTVSANGYQTVYVQEEKNTKGIYFE